MKNTFFKPFTKNVFLGIWILLLIAPILFAEQQWVIAEVFTATTCGFCPGARSALNQMNRNREQFPYLIPIIWQSDGTHQSPGYTTRRTLYGFAGIPHARFCGNDAVGGGGAAVLQNYTNAYNRTVTRNAPMEISVVTRMNDQNQMVVTADVVMTGNINTPNTKVIFVLTYDLTGIMGPDYFASAKTYHEVDFTLTQQGQQQRFVRTYDMEQGWDTERIRAVVFVQSLVQANPIIHQGGYGWLGNNAPYPNVAVNPNPANDTTGVSINLESLAWDYIEHPLYMSPVGFRVYLNTIEQFGEEDEYVWVPYVAEQENYNTAEILPERLEENTRYYWKVVPTTNEPERGSGRMRRSQAERGNELMIDRGDAENVPVWSFLTVFSHLPYVILQSDETLNFGVVYLGDTSDTLQVWIKNIGTDTLRVDSLSFYREESKFSFLDADFPLQVAFEDSASISVVFRTSIVEVVSDSLYIHSNAVNMPVLAVGLRGRGEYVPPKSPENVRVVLEAYDAIITWDEVTETIYGTPIEPDCYIILYNEVADTEPDRYFFLARADNTTHTHYYVAQFRETIFYRVVAIKFRNRQRSTRFDEERLFEERITWGELQMMLRGD